MNCFETVASWVILFRSFVTSRVSKDLCAYVTDSLLVKLPLTSSLEATKEVLVFGWSSPSQSRNERQSLFTSQSRRWRSRLSKRNVAFCWRLTSIEANTVTIPPPIITLSRIFPCMCTGTRATILFQTGQMVHFDWTIIFWREN